MRSAALLAVSLASLALSCRMECDLAVGGVGCTAGGDDPPGCRADSECPAGQFCDLALERCPGADAGVLLLSRVASATCRPIPADTRGQPCGSSSECAPDEACAGGRCKLLAPCSGLSACPGSCALQPEPHVACPACICDC